MKNIFTLTFILFSLISLSHAQINLGKTLKDIKDETNKVTGNSQGLTNEEVIKGLKEALTIGTGNATTLASKVNGYYKNPEIFIPFPPEAEKVKTAAENIGLHEQVRKFEMTLNRAAEEAAKEATPIFVNAVKQMTIKDGFNILKGNDDAATMYLKDKTYQELYVKFLPIVERAIQKVEVTKHWTPLAQSYNKIPFVEKVNPDLDKYVTERAMEGLFILLAKEELKIRKDPAARVTDILKKVFG